MSNIMFGTDPESDAVYFDGEGNPMVLPPYHFRTELQVPVSMENPKHPVFLRGDGYEIHEDGTAFEFRVRPSTNPRELYDMVHSAKNRFEEEILRKFPNECLPELQFLPTVGFEVNRWLNAGPDFEWATRFGCDPQQDVCNLDREDREIDAKFWPWRYDGGHIHVSGSKFIENDPHMAIWCMMMTAGIAGIALSDVPELEKARTWRYGIPGNFRTQNYGDDNPYGREYQYGVEYRAPSATWLKSWSIAEPFLNWAEIGVKVLLEKGLGVELLKNIREEVIETILSANQPKANQLLAYVSSKI